MNARKLERLTMPCRAWAATSFIQEAEEANKAESYTAI